MKAALILFFLMLIITPTPYKGSSQITKTKLHRIIRIDSVDQVYLIYTSKNNCLFKIMSAKEKLNDCNALELNQYYDLDVMSYFEGRDIVILELAGVEFNGTEILFERDSINDLYVANNIKGLCFVD